MESEEQPQRKRRVRYKGKHPRRFEEKYKEHNPERYPEDVEKVIKSGHTPAGTHIPIMVREVLEALAPKPGETGLDATLGFGGHARELLARIRPGEFFIETRTGKPRAKEARGFPAGRLFALDTDPIEIVRTEERLRRLGFTEEELIIRRMNFAGIPKILAEAGGGFDFILADLGVSSMQLDNPARGFTYKAEGPLDLRLNPERGQPAAVLLKSFSEEALEKMLRMNSDEPRAKEIAKVIYQKRNALGTTTALAQAVREALPWGFDPAADKETVKAIRRTFQALRIHINDEFSALEQFLRNLPLCLNPGGRAAVISFHSGEDNRVMKFFSEGFEAGIYREISGEAVRPGYEECYGNPRAKSAVLRWAKKP